MTILHKHSLVLYFFLALFSSLVLAKSDGKLPPGETPFTDPKDDPNNPLRYIPNNILTAVAVPLYLFTSCSMVYLLLVSRWRARYMLSVVIGGFGELPYLIPINAQSITG